jgi:ferredoxin
MAEKVKKIEVDRELCIGAASCVGIAPEAFELDVENIAILKSDWQSLSDEILIAAAESCPTKAIFLYDGNGQQIFP